MLGAGDAFSSGFMSGWVRGEDYDACARYANACGALVVSRHGCAPAMPTRIELDYFIANAERIPARNPLGVGNEIIELDARRHRRRAAVARDDERAAGVRVARAGIVVLAAHPARQEARRERVARAQHVQHFDVDAACR